MIIDMTEKPQGIDSIAFFSNGKYHINRRQKLDVGSNTVHKMY
jgi:hypothetical protein